MKIQVGGMSEGAHEYLFESAPAEISLGENFSAPVEVAASLEKSATQFFLKAHIRAQGVFVCDRCLAEFTLSLTPQYQMLYVLEGTGADNLDPAEIQVIPHGFTIIDLTEDVRQTIILSVPLKLLCREDCKGLCPVCGADRNTRSCTCTTTIIDERWEKLLPDKRNIRN